MFRRGFCTRVQSCLKYIKRRTGHYNGHKVVISLVDFAELVPKTHYQHNTSIPLVLGLELFVIRFPYRTASGQ